MLLANSSGLSKLSLAIRDKKAQSQKSKGKTVKYLPDLGSQQLGVQVKSSNICCAKTPVKIFTC